MDHVNGIVSMDPDNLREVDGVVFDLTSYARHCEPIHEPVQALETASTAPTPIFPADPVHLGWYDAEEEKSRVPIMGGCLPPSHEILESTAQESVVLRRFVPIGAGSGSYQTSYTTSHLTSWSGSGYGSINWGSGVFLVGGYGLELI
ncbi:hypothetical protein [Agathobaculum sp.]|uniref:hypothetical protein n=1 Tax=Agathobaculum sp. TaxID=2048138 RepID=UPI002A7FCAFA|nr:hypothetical protein [Agathobaculum sp.]MDY3618956.1 hypothetical protein [Agathobaculum sp.]